MSKTRREMVNSAIKHVPESNAPKSRGETIDRLVEAVADHESVQVGRQQGVHGLVEPVADAQVY
jgi:hypothetical protein